MKTITDYGMALDEAGARGAAWVVAQAGSGGRWLIEGHQGYTSRWLWSVMVERDPAGFLRAAGLDHLAVNGRQSDRRMVFFD